MAALKLQAALRKRDADAQQLRAALDEARADLQRDEQLFAYRTAAHKAARSRAEAADAAGLAMRAELAALAALLPKAPSPQKSALPAAGDDAWLDFEAAANYDGAAASRDRDGARLAALEHEIAMKEQCIATLAASEDEAALALGRYEARVAALEGEPMLRQTAQFELDELQRQRRASGAFGHVARLAGLSEARLRQLQAEAEGLRRERDALLMQPAIEARDAPAVQSRDAPLSAPAAAPTSVEAPSCAPSGARRHRGPCCACSPAPQHAAGPGPADARGDDGGAAANKAAARWLKRRLDAVVAVARDQAALTSRRRLAGETLDADGAADDGRVPPASADRGRAPESPMPSVYAAFGDLSRELESVDAAVASAALLEASRQIVALRLARDDDQAAIAPSRVRGDGKRGPPRPRRSTEA
ncbi:hypothetical protein M885DRAFT_536942 [Pelagophyceae sp. CCMP2097]|nr:hypothetical protein M885DRAFT_536942 [Pelagophyceae sp. CCMP2097]